MNHDEYTTSITTAGRWGYEYNPPEHLETEVFPDKIEISYKAYSKFCYGNDLPHPKVWKDIYKAVDGELRLVETIEGRYIPASREQFIFE